MNHPRARRGEPLIALGAVLLGWVGLRVALWEGITLPALPASVAQADTRVALPFVPRVDPATPALAALIPSTVRALPAALSPLAPPPTLIARPVPPAAEPGLPPGFAPVSGADQTARVAAAHQLAWMAGVAQLPLPQFLVERMNPREQGAGLVPAEAREARVGPLTAKRWSVDGWLLLREGGVTATAAGLPSPSYGASQTGAVIRYRIAPGNAHRPALYLRATSAVQAPRGEELAMGLAARPAARIPIALQVELRATQQISGTIWRPAVAAVTELPRFELPAGLSGEVYAQAGYVGGPGKTAFVDGQLRIERRLARLGRGELRAGLGAWGGAQKDANRLDVGPSATLDFPVGGGQARVSADWRLRAAGNAVPKSGPAITLSAGF